MKELFISSMDMLKKMSHDTTSPNSFIKPFSIYRKNYQKKKKKKRKYKTEGRIRRVQY